MCGFPNEMCGFLIGSLGAIVGSFVLLELDEVFVVLAELMLPDLTRFGII